MSKVIFDLLVAHAENAGVPVKDADAGRYISRHSDDDADLMAKADVTCLSITRKIRLLRLVHGETTYFCALGITNPAELPAGLVETPLTPGIFAACVVEGGIRPLLSSSGYAIKDAIESQIIDEGDSYVGHTLEQITQFFPILYVYSASGREDFHQSDVRVISALVASSYHDGPLEFSDQNLSNISALIQSGSPYIPYGNLLQGVLGLYWSTFYLELYKCVEQLYAAPRLLKLCETWPSEVPLHDLAIQVEKALGWRPKEDDALSKLLAQCDSTTVENGRAAFELPALEKDQSPSDQLANAIYKLRNGVAHYRPATKMEEKQPEQWRGIIEAMLDIVDELYAKFGDRFFPAGA